VLNALRSAFLEQSDLTESARERERERGKKKSDEPARNREVRKMEGSRNI